jgi:hypothetical protein
MFTMISSKFQNAFSENGVYEFYFIGKIVEFTVPTERARCGSNNSTTGPPGAYSKSFVLLSKDEIIRILVFR